MTAGADHLLGQDMQNGLSIERLTVVDPFNCAKAALIDLLLAPMEGVKRP